MLFYGAKSAFLIPETTARQYTETRLVGFSVQQMYDVASNVQHYKEFVPWCMKSELVKEVNQKEADWLLEVGFPPILEQYVSR